MKIVILIINLIRTFTIIPENKKIQTDRTAYIYHVSLQYKNAD
jgi:hypothetical protein